MKNKLKNWLNQKSVKWDLLKDQGILLDVFR